MVPFAGYEMPVQYPLGILKEHLHTRAEAGLFDVSHMGQAVSRSVPITRRRRAALEALVPADIAGLKPGQQRYSQLLNDEGGIIDDLMVTRPASAEDDGRLFLVVNAARKDVDYAAHRSASAGRRDADAARRPRAAGAAGAGGRGCDGEAVGRGRQAAASCTAAASRVGDFDCHVSRSGYTGEDGFEISVAADQATDLARLLLAQADVQPIGLGARDSLRLEAGLCLYGHDIDETTSPIEAGLAWSIQKRRRTEGGFPGVERIQRRAGARARPQARRHQAGGTRAGARGHRDPRHAGRAHRHRHLGRLRAERQRPGRHGLRAVRLRRRPARRST